MDITGTQAPDLAQKIEAMTTEVANLNGLLKKMLYAQQKAVTLEPIEIKSEEPAAQVKQSPPLAKPPAGNVAYDDLKGAITTLATTKGRQAALNVLKQFGVNKATELDKSAYHDCYLAIKDASL